MGAIAGPFSYYGGVKWGSVELPWSPPSATPAPGIDWWFWGAMIVIGIEWALGMPALLWLSAKWVPASEGKENGK